jgi:hypothetical protein
LLQVHPGFLVRAVVHAGLLMRVSPPPDCSL